MGKLPLKIIVPITDWKDKYEIAPWMVKIEPDFLNGLNKVSAIDCFQIRSISQNRFIKKVGVISDKLMDEIRISVSKVLSL